MTKSNLPPEQILQIRQIAQLQILYTYWSMIRHGMLQKDAKRQAFLGMIVSEFGKLPEFSNKTDLFGYIQNRVGYAFNRDAEVPDSAFSIMLDVCEKYFLEHLDKEKITTPAAMHPSIQIMQSELSRDEVHKMLRLLKFSSRNIEVFFEQQHHQPGGTKSPENDSSQIEEQFEASSFKLKLSNFINKISWIVYDRPWILLIIVMLCVIELIIWPFAKHQCNDCTDEPVPAKDSVSFKVGPFDKSLLRFTTSESTTLNPDSDIWSDTVNVSYTVSKALTCDIHYHNTGTEVAHEISLIMEWPKSVDTTTYLIPINVIIYSKQPKGLIPLLSEKQTIKLLSHTRLDLDTVFLIWNPYKRTNKIFPYVQEPNDIFDGGIYLGDVFPGEEGDVYVRYLVSYFSN